MRQIRLACVQPPTSVQKWSLRLFKHAIWQQPLEKTHRIAGTDSTDSTEGIDGTHRTEGQTGVRSRVHLSCTETRFRKCSQSGKNGSKHPILSIYGLQCDFMQKKSKVTLKKSKSLILLCKFGSRAYRPPKIPPKKLCTESLFAQVFL